VTGGDPDLVGELELGETPSVTPLPEGRPGRAHGGDITPQVIAGTTDLPWTAPTAHRRAAGPENLEERP